MDTSLHSNVTHKYYCAMDWTRTPQQCDFGRRVTGYHFTVGVTPDDELPLHVATNESEGLSLLCFSLASLAVEIDR